MTVTAILNSRFSYRTRTTRDGTFKISIRQPGEYVVVAYDEEHAASATTLMVYALLRPVELRLQPLAVPPP